MNWHSAQAADHLAKVVHLVEAAGQMLREEFLRPGGPRGSGSKAPIDNEIEAYLREKLQSIVPGRVVGDEHHARRGRRGTKSERKT